MAVLQQNWLYEIIGGTLPMSQNTTMWVNGAWIKIYRVLCSETYNTLHSCHNFLADSRQADRGARICETSLLGSRTSADTVMTKFAWWRNQMKPFSALLVFCAGTSPHNGQRRRDLMFLWYAPEPTAEQTMETPVTWDAIALIMTSL